MRNRRFFTLVVMVLPLPLAALQLAFEADSFSRWWEMFKYLLLLWLFFFLYLVGCLYACNGQASGESDLS